MNTELRIKHHLPDGFLDCPAPKLYQLIPEPTLFHLDWECGHIHKERLFICILLHGDEVAGLHAVQSLLSQSDYIPARPISLFVGNIDAAKNQVRRLESQIDFNRCWPGGAYSETVEGKVMQQLIDEMTSYNVFASIDIHNNTGINPHYGCINSKSSDFLTLASLFSKEIVYFIRPVGVQSMAFSKLCPAVTLECGTIGDADGVSHAKEYLERVLKLDTLIGSVTAGKSFDVLHTIGQITLDAESSFSFDGSDADVMFINNFEQRNFKRLEPGFAIASVKGRGSYPVQVINELGENATQEYFSIENDQLVLKQSVIPSMITTSQQAVRQDCLGYFMESISI